MSRFKLRIDGPEGKIETVINDPGPERKGLAIVAHPHPLHGGSLDNKVVTTIATALFDLGYVAVRLNFRGVGLSEGEYDHGVGEVNDVLAVWEFVNQRYPGLPLVLAGFSFGAAVQSQVSLKTQPKHLLLVGPAVNLFKMGAAPRNTLVIHGEQDEVVPLDKVRAWTAQYAVPLTVIADADHFFHKKLTQLKERILQLCPC